MQNVLKSLVAAGILGVTCASASALTVVVNGGTTNATDNGAFGTGGRSLILTNFAFSSVGSTSAFLDLTITPTAGFHLTGLSYLPQGQIRNASYSIDAPGVLLDNTWSVGNANLSLTASPVSKSFIAFGTLNLGLTVTATINPSVFKYVNAKNFNISFTEAANPVPEPASIAALGVGALGLISKRRKK